MRIFLLSCASAPPAATARMAAAAASVRKSVMAVPCSVVGCRGVPAAAFGIVSRLQGHAQPLSPDRPRPRARRERLHGFGACVGPVRLVYPRFLATCYSLRIFL